MCHIYVFRTGRLANPWLASRMRPTGAVNSKRCKPTSTHEAVRSGTAWAERTETRKSAMTVVCCRARLCFT